MTAPRSFGEARMPHSGDQGAPPGHLVVAGTTLANPGRQGLWDCAQAWWRRTRHASRGRLR